MAELRHPKLNKAYPKTQPPHWFGRHTAAQRMWLLSLGLLPVWVCRFVIDGFRAFFVLALSIFFSWFFEWISSKCFKQKSGFKHGDIFFTGVLFAFLLPANSPWWAVATGMFFAVVVGNMCFGGWGQNLFSLPLIGMASLLVLFPAALTAHYRASESIVLSQGVHLSTWLLGNSVTPGILAVLCGGAFLIFKRLVPWQMPALYLMTIVILALFSGNELSRYFASSCFLFSAFFIVTDLAVCPITPIGRAIFSVGSAALVFILSLRLSSYESVAYSILMMNGLVPFADRYLKPK